LSFGVFHDVENLKPRQLLSTEISTAACPRLALRGEGV